MVNEDQIRKKLRSKAEAKIKKEPRSKLDLTMEKANTLMHELEVHQIELEMQNQELREALHRIEQARDQYTDLFDFAPVGYLVINEKSVIQNINLTACTLMGVDVMNIKGKPFSVYMSGEKSRNFFLRLREAFEKDVFKPFELQIKRKGNDSFTALLHGKVTQNGQGKATCRLSMQDITELREAEILQKQHKDLQAEKEKIERYLDLAPVVFLLLDNENRVQLINQKGCDLFGFGKQVLHGENWFEYVRPTRVEDENTETPRYFKHKKILSQHYFESKVRCKNGHLRLMGWTNTPLKDKFGETIGTLSSGEDITERKKLEAVKQKYTENLVKTVQERTKELSEALEAEKRINEMKSNLITIASHELRTPITIILSSIILIERYSEKEDYEKQKKLIDRIKSAVSQLTSILDDFLSLDKLERGMCRVNKEIFNIEKFVGQLMDDMEGMHHNGKRIRHDHKGNKMIVQDQKMLKHIISNLLSNAIKYSDGAIEVYTSVAKGKLTVQIKDWGIGIPEEDQEQLFKRFYRAKNVEHFQGTGLGLSLVERYLDLLGGRIELTSTLGEGSTFTIVLPEEE